MRPASLDLLRPAGAAPAAPLALDVFVADGDHVIEGRLRTPDPAVWYPILRGVPCFGTGALRPDVSAFCARHGLTPPSDVAASPHASEQARTSETFSDKWRRFPRYGLEPAHQDFLLDWACRKLGLPDREALIAFYRDRGRVLEVGPGSGFYTRFIAEHSRGQVWALDVSDAAFTTFENTRHLSNCATVQADLMQAPFADDTFDLVVADGVLHHTQDTRAGLAALYRMVRPGGQLFFHVYRRMGPARRFTDDHIRAELGRLAPEDCYAACEGLTDLGRELSRLGATITLEKPIPVLGIPAGTHDVQRLLYYHFVKCFWNDAFDYATNNMVNFDWYHPHHAWQHTEDEVRGWLGALGVRDFTFHDANPNGISVVLSKPAA